MIDPRISVLTWADYADIHDHRMSILRTFNYYQVESLPSVFRGYLAMQLICEDWQGKSTLQVLLRDKDYSVVSLSSIVVTAGETPTGKYVVQIPLHFEFQLECDFYSVEVSQLETEKEIFSLPLPIIVKSALK